MIRKALSVEPDNGYFVDSLGWVFYQMGRYDEAARELERAVELTREEDPTILEHLGDAYRKAGRRDAAHRAYLKSRQLDPRNEAIQEKIEALEQNSGKP
jgi:Flp pilus assembly protein TadD